MSLRAQLEKIAPNVSDDGLALAHVIRGLPEGSTLRYGEALALSGTATTAGARKARRMTLINTGAVNVKVEFGTGGTASAAEGFWIIPGGWSMEVFSAEQVQPICTPLTAASLTVVINYQDAATP